ncbi:MAG: protease complex subunit PrcB family protein [Ruminococcus sp.]|jgi:hypothetical protein
MKRIGQILWVVLLSLCIAGCGIRNMDAEEEKELDYTVVQEDHIPEEVLKIIQEKKGQKFQMTYQSQDYLYIMVGYGIQNSGGYSITVEKLAQKGEGIYCETRLTGPSDREEMTKEVSYPYIVIKTEYRDAPVIFKES